MGFLRQLMDTLLHLSPDSINAFVASVGPGLSYTVLFLIIFAETGLVVTPFLPGDSLLFAVGAVTASAGSPIKLGTMAVLLVVAAILGDAVNYAVGYFVGPRVFSSEKSRLLNKKHLMRPTSSTRSMAASPSSSRGSCRSSGRSPRSSPVSAR